jgi:hypothetical protein
MPEQTYTTDEVRIRLGLKVRATVFYRASRAGIKPRMKHPKLASWTESQVRKMETK